MSRFHNSSEQEELALKWHEWGLLISAVGALASAASLVLCLGGAFWHRWARQQHRERLSELRRFEDS